MDLWQIFWFLCQTSVAVNKNGGFLVRDSKHGGVDSPYTLTVLNEGRVFNINIRVKQDGHMALGKEKCDEIVSGIDGYTDKFWLHILI